MAYQVLSRKWRPRKFQDVIGQSHITQSLVNSLKLNKLGHAYLFTGTRGIGKTTVARIFAKALRCEALLEDGNPCNTCASCLDFATGSSMNVYEIDGASNNSVDDIRELISNVQYLPTTGKYKVYIIDEVHMLSTSAFNALLKTLEEPPEHVIFLFATTEPHKLLDTVLSRCQRFDFKNATNKEIIHLLETIAEKEKIRFPNDETLEQLAIQGKGSFRDTLSLLDQVLSFSLDGEITDDVLANALGLATQTEIRKLLDAALNGDGVQTSVTFHTMLDKNIGLENILRSLQDFLFKAIQSVEINEISGEVANIQKLSEYSLPELYWVFETMAKEFVWSVKCLSPENASELVLKKICYRRQFFNANAEPVSVAPVARAMVSEVIVEPIVPQKELQEEAQKEIKDEKKKVEQPLAIDTSPITAAMAMLENPEDVQVSSGLDNTGEGVTEEQSRPEETSFKQADVPSQKSYDSFLNYVNTLSPATASNLEQGNIIGEPRYTQGEGIELEITFAQSSKVFYDFLNEVEVFQKVTKYLSEYYELDPGKVMLKLDLIEGAKDSQEFVSVADIKKKEAEQQLKDREENIRNNPFIREAEQLFSTKVDKVILNND